MEVTTELARFTAGLRTAPLPTAVVDQTKRCVLDLIGITLRAADEAESTPAIASTIEDLAPGDGPATAIGHSRGFAPQYAAFLNGAYGHSLDFDDTHAGSSLHPGAPVIPAAWAIAETTGATGADVLRAIVAGYEVTVRLAEALPAAAHYERGFHPTATAGTFGAATAAALLLGADAAELANAWGVALSFTSGTLAFVENGSWNKRFQVGWAAHNGVIAAKLSHRGTLGATRAIDGKYGFLNAYSNSPTPAKALEGLGERWTVCETALKPYPSCRYTHSAIDGLIDLAIQHDLAVDDITLVEVGMSAPGIALCAVPAERKQDPQNVVDGQFSMHWLAAVALAKRRVGWSDYSLVRDPQILALTKRVVVHHDADVQANHPAAWSASLKVTLKSGQELAAFVLRPKGEPEAPLTWADVETKFHSLAETTVDARRRAEIVDRVKRLDQLDGVAELTRRLRPIAASAAAD